MYVYLLPQGGFNDMLCVIERTLEYCKKYKKTLLLDTVNSVYNINFSEYFNFNLENNDVNNDINNPNDNKVNIISDINEIIKIVKENNSTSFYPKCINTNIMLNILNGKIKFTFCQKEIIYKFNNKSLSLVNENINENIIIYSFCGGGNGYNLFKNLTFNSNIKEKCKERYEKILKPYLSIQVRNTDYKCDYIKLYNENKDLIHSNLYNSLYIATDDENVIKFFKSNNLGLNIFNFTTFNSNKKVNNLHYNTSINGNTKIIDLMTDIYIISMSNKLLSNSQGGFIELVRNCYNNKNIF